eukprot:5545403-Pleurochrysis_carterae.AAC.3
MPSTTAVHYKGDAFAASVPGVRSGESLGATCKQSSSVSRRSTRNRRPRPERNRRRRWAGRSGRWRSRWQRRCSRCESDENRGENACRAHGIQRAGQERCGVIVTIRSARSAARAIASRQRADEHRRMKTEVQFTSTTMREGKDTEALFAFNPIMCAAKARYAYTATSVRVSNTDTSRASTNRVAADRSDASRARSEGA